MPPHTVSKAPRPNGANNYRFRRSSLIRLALLRHPCLSPGICANGFRRHRGGVGAILLTLSSLNYLKDLQAYTSFSGTGGTVTVENRAEFCSRQIRHFLRPCRSDVFVEATWTYSQQLPCLTASSPSLARARKHVAMQLSPCHRIACAKSAPQVMDYTVAGSSASTNLGTFSWKL